MSHNIGQWFPNCELWLSEKPQIILSKNLPCNIKDCKPHGELGSMVQ